MEIQDNKMIYAFAFLVLILIVSIGVISYKGDFTSTASGKAVSVPTESQITHSSADGRVSITIDPKQPVETGGE